MARYIISALASLALAASAPAFPPVGARVSFFPSSNPSIGLRHCDYVCSATPLENSEDFVFTVTAPRNGNSAPGAVSLTSANFPDHALSPIVGSASVGINTNPDADDSTWMLTPGLMNASDWTVVTQSKRGDLAGFVISLGRATTNPCHDGPDIVLAAPGAAGVDAQTWAVHSPPPPPPPPPSTVTIAAGVVTSELPTSILGCHSDKGFMHQPQSFLSQMVYGEGFETTNGMRSGWDVALDGSAQGSAQLDNSQRFAAAQRPSMHVVFASGSGAVRLTHRGMGNEGLVFQAGKPYEGYIFARSSAATQLTVALNDYVGGAVLASAVLQVPGGGAWTQLGYALTPSAGTNCVGIDSDPAISCSDPFGDYICIKCAGELSYNLVAAGDEVWIGYARLEPGAWGRFAGLPVRIEAFDTLRAMGVTALRYGGSVGASVSWQDFRGPVWNRTSLGRTWAACDLSGWGPFDAMDFFAAANISVAVTMAMTVTPEYFADLVEYAVGGPSTPWGAQRIADGHPALYEPLAFELGNEEYNPNFVQQVAAMEARAAAIGYSPRWNYMFPDNGGMSAADQAAAVAAGLPIERIAVDMHVGSAGGVQALAGVFSKSPAFMQSGINGEVNAIYGDDATGASALDRALSEAADINDWANYDAGVLKRILARTASFCTERNGHDDGSQWHQGLSFFLPNMTWLGPAGQYHAMLANTWASGALAVDYNAAGPVSVSAQKDEAAGRVVVRIANKNAAPAVVQLVITGFASRTDVTVTTLSGASLTQTNPPWDPLAIAPVVSNMTLASGGGNVTVPAFAAVALELFAA